MGVLVLGLWSFPMTGGGPGAPAAGSAGFAGFAGFAGPGTYRPPVSAPVADPFRPPPEPWLAGNRGIEYRTVPGTLVRAIGPGVVTFAGLVAGEVDLTIRHPDGLRSSYVDLASVRVRRGDRIDAGQVVGAATDRLHLGVRRGDTYLDPASLWGTRLAGRVVLVPDGRPRSRAGAGPDSAPDSAPHPGPDTARGRRPTAPGVLAPQVADLVRGIGRIAAAAVAVAAG
ncbi:MAG: peptidase family protein [Acidimicrobiales bacterium]|nr:peptidase family protein [Acidimicrobiales bacterium]